MAFLLSQHGQNNNKNEPLSVEQYVWSVTVRVMMALSMKVIVRLSSRHASDWFPNFNYFNGWH